MHLSDLFPVQVIPLPFPTACHSIPTLIITVTPSTTVGSGRQADSSDKARRLSSVYVLPFINLHGLNRNRESHGDEDAPLSFYNVALLDRWVIIKFIHNNQPKRSESTRRRVDRFSTKNITKSPFFERLCSNPPHSPVLPTTSDHYKESL